MSTYLANTLVETMAGRARQVQAFFQEPSQSRGCDAPHRSDRPGCPSA
ncbi:MAG TPA: hypothetical protein VKY90_19605 [Candidatus Dormibacteraeota bacterium]|nr:hypothetical protein [Candidatus Dormibacteraeota bacterium]